MPALSPTWNHPDLIVSEKLPPEQAVRDAIKLIEYAQSHSSRFSLKDRATMGPCLDYLARVL